MIREITFGQYYAADSPIHRLDPRIKLFGTLIYIISLFVANNIVSYAVAALFLGIIIIISTVPVKFILKGLKPILFILLFSVAFNAVLTNGEHVLAKWGVFVISTEGLIRAAYMGARLIMLIMGSSLMTYTTTPNELTDGLEKSLGFLRKINIPVHEMAMMMSIALRFIPILIEETDKIMKAQMARGADFENGNIIHRVKSMVPLLIPLFVSAFRRASDLAMAMEARCYHGGEGRTKMKPLQYKRADYIGYIIVLVYFAVIIATRILFKNVLHF